MFQLLDSDVGKIFSTIGQDHILLRSGLKELAQKIVFHEHGETEISDLKIGTSMMTSSAFICLILVRTSENVSCRTIVIFLYDQGSNLG